MERTQYPVQGTLSADAAEFQLLVQSTGTFAPTGANTAGADGAQLAIAQQTGEAGEAIAVNFVGVDKIIAGGAISQFDELIPAASGRVTALAAETGVAVVGKALDAAAAAGDVIRVALYVEPRIIPSP